MCSSSSPPTPDYVGAAQATADSSKEVTNAQTYANRPNVTTPWGSQTYTQAVVKDPATGADVTQWNQNISLTPSEQQALDSQQAIQQGRSNTAETLLGQADANFQTPFDWAGLPSAASNVNAGQMNTTAGQSGFSFGSAPQASTAYAQQAQDAINKLQQPGLDQQRTAATANLANSGLTQGSEAYENAMRDVNDNEDRAHLMAIQAGDTQAQNMYNQDLGTAQFQNQTQAQDQSQILARDTFGNQATTQNEANQIQAGNFQNQNRATAIGEQQLKRGMTLNELNALLTGQQVQNPSFNGSANAGAAQGVNASGALNSSYGAALDASNAQNAQSNANTAAGGSALAMAAMYAFSDLRLKEDITETGLDIDGIRVVRYRYRGRSRRFLGVIAQEVAKVKPQAVILHPSGFLMVDYSQL